jgi:hypothetical protein
VLFAREKVAGERSGMGMEVCAVGFEAGVDLGPGRIGGCGGSVIAFGRENVIWVGAFCGFTWERAAIILGVRYTHDKGTLLA